MKQRNPIASTVLKRTLIHRIADKRSSRKLRGHKKRAGASRLHSLERQASIDGMLRGVRSRYDMVRPGQVMENPVSGEDRIVFTKTAQQTGGELFELEVLVVVHLVLFKQIQL